jgi:hypothetical protein
MAKMSQYTPLDENDKEYFFGEGEGAVVTVGETSASSGKVNRLVKLSDIGGGGGDAESLAGQGLYASNGKLTVDTDDTLKIVEVGYFDDDKRYKVSVTNAVPTPGADHADVGKVLTVKNVDNTDEIVWDAAPAPGGSDPFADIGEWDDGKTPPTKVKDYNEFPLEDKGFYISVKKENDIIKHRFCFQYGGSGSNFYGPWAS